MKTNATLNRGSLPFPTTLQSVQIAPSATWTKDSQNWQQLSGLLERHSIGPRRLSDPGPSLAELRQAIACALRAPDHGQLHPWRAVLVTPDQRIALSERFADFARAVGKNGEEVNIERRRADNGPMLIAWISKVTPGITRVPLHEQWIAVGGALTNFLNAMHLMGYGAKTLSGRKCQHHTVRDAFCSETETLVAFICVGTPTNTEIRRGATDIDTVLSIWPGA